MLVFNEDIEKMLKSVASELKLGFQKTKVHREESYNFIYKDNLLITFSIIINPYKDYINFLASVPGMKPIVTGSFKKEELMTKARKTILSKTKELISKQ